MIIVKRESIIIEKEEEEDEIWNCLVIYDKNNNILTKSNTYHPGEEILLEYDGLTYISYPNCPHGIFITLDSINNKFK